MAKKRAIIGFKGIALAPVTENTITAYKTEEAMAIPYAGSMTRTPKETVQDIFYDDNMWQSWSITFASSQSGFRMRTTSPPPWTKKW